MIRHYCDLNEEQKHFIYETVNRTKDESKSTTQIKYEILPSVRHEFAVFSINQQMEKLTDEGKEFAKKVLEILQ